MSITRWLRGLSGPERILISGTALFSLGRGMYAAASVIYFTRWVGLSARQVGVALSVAGVMSFLAAVPAGRVADRIGARNASIVVQLGQAALIAGLTVVRSFAVLVVIAAMLGAADRGNQVTRQALVADVVSAGERVRAQAYVRSTFNLGVSVGVALAALVIAATSRWAFVLMLLGIAACYGLVTVTTAWLPSKRRAARAAHTARPPRPVPSFILLGLVSGVLALHVSILEVGIPLWILHETRCPPALVSGLILVNTLTTVLLQVAASRGSSSVPGAARALALSGVATATSCVMFAATHGGGGWLTIGLLVLAVLVLTGGEMWQSAGSWGLAFGLSPEQSRGSHIGAFSIGAALQDSLGPALIAFLVVSKPPGGWFMLAAVLAVAGLTVVPLTRRVQRFQPGLETSAAGTQAAAGTRQ